MARGKVTPEEVRAMLRDVADRIERGGLSSVTMKVDTTDGELEYTFSLKTEEEQLAALLAIRTILGQVH